MDEECILMVSKYGEHNKWMKSMCKCISNISINMLWLVAASANRKMVKRQGNCCINTRQKKLCLPFQQIPINNKQVDRSRPIPCSLCSPSGKQGWYTWVVIDISRSEFFVVMICCRGWCRYLWLCLWFCFFVGSVCMLLLVGCGVSSILNEAMLLYCKMTRLNETMILIMILMETAKNCYVYTYTFSPWLLGGIGCQRRLQRWIQ